MCSAEWFLVLQLPISQERLEAYREPGGSDLDTLANYFWNVELSEALYPSLQAFEIALRNSIHTALVQHFQNVHWFDQADLMLDWQMEAIAKARDELSLHKKPHDPGRIIAELHFGFWHSMFNRPYEEVLWYADGARLLEAVFPHLPRPLRTRKEVGKRIDRIRRLRNRVFHYEPIWRKRDLEELAVITHEMLAAISPELEAVIALSSRFSEVLRHGPEHTRANLIKIIEVG